MGLMKKIKNSYLATHMEVGKYTKRRANGSSSARDFPSNDADYAVTGTVRPVAGEFISEFDQAADDLRREQERAARMQPPSMARRTATEPQWSTRGAETLDDSSIVDSRGRTLQHKRTDNFRQLSHYKSSIDVASSSRSRSQRREEMLAGASSPGSVLPFAGASASSLSASQTTTAVSTPGSSPFGDSSNDFGATTEQPAPVPRARPKGARAGRSAINTQSVYFAPGRNITVPNQVVGAVAGSTLSPGERRPQFDKNSASSMDYYVFTPTRRDLSSMPLDMKKKHRGMVAPDSQLAKSLHRNEVREEANSPVSPMSPVNANNPFVARQKKAQQMVDQGWNSTSPFEDPVVGSGRGGINPDEPRKYLTTPVYANQAGGTTFGPNAGVDLLA
ncbi:hypothetical protein GQ54DRAFT_77252 [Martensiomyces pterosporus]|nr:hypothetical protein GQ54DRAFT_77252 [Martensiomyces pterosporus]